MAADIRRLDQTLPTPVWDLTRKLEQAGIAPGMPIAIVGHEVRHDLWSRLARARIVAQTLNDSAFWTSPAADREGLLDAFARAGARAVVATRSPRQAAEDAWSDVPGTEYSVRLLRVVD